LIKESIIKILLFPSFIQTYASLLAKEWILRVFHLVKVVFQKLSLEDIFKHYFFIKDYFLFSKDLFSNPIQLYASKNLWPQSIFLLKILFWFWKLVSYWFKTLQWNLQISESGSIWFGAILQILWKK
jgi:hypothetical protein